jgi:putative nucleotidyltransferase with HDIG domain
VPFAVDVDVDAARRLAAQLFTQGSPHFLHAQETARRAEQIAPVVGPIDRDVLVCAAWLHDIGFCAEAVRTGFHPLDGALLLQERGWSPRVVAQVAHHCEARVTAAALDLEEPMRPFRREEGPLTDALVYADLAAGPDGRRMCMRERLAEIDARYADQSAELREVWGRRRVALVRAAERTEQRMAGLHRSLRAAG